MGRKRMDNETFDHAEDVAAGATDNILVAAVAGKSIRVHSLVHQAGATATTIVYESGTTTALTPTFQCGVNGGVVLPPTRDGWFETAPGEALTCTTGAGSQIGILLTYTLIP